MTTTEDKRRIAARIFFTDNQDQYEDFHEALAEFISGANQSEKFIDFCVEPVIRPEDGHVLVMNDAGHVGAIRTKDDFFSPRTDMTEEEGEEFQAAFEKVADENPEIGDCLVLVQKIGWRLLSQDKVAAIRKEGL